MDAPVLNNPETIATRSGGSSSHSSDCRRQTWCAVISRVSRTEGVSPQSSVGNVRRAAIAHRNPGDGGVPFYIRAGKRLPVTATEVYGRTEHPEEVFDMFATGTELLSIPSEPGRFILPELASRLGRIHVRREIELIAPQRRRFDDALRTSARRCDSSDASLYARYDSVEEAWRWWINSRGIALRFWSTATPGVNRHQMNHC